MSETDHELLRTFATDRCETAFRTLVDRHLPVVWSCAHRVTNGDRALAQDVAQLVFADLAAKARKIPATMPLGGWLHRHAFFTASKAVRAEVRRRAREAHAATTSAMSDPPAHARRADDPGAPDEPDAVWAQLAPHLDAELAALSPDDRAALVLRFFEKRSHRSVAVELGLTEDAARKRIDRALVKLRRRLEKKGLSFASGAALAALLPHALVAPPAGLAVSVTVAAAAAGIAASATATGGSLLASFIARLGPSTTVVTGMAAAVVVFGGLVWSLRRGVLETRGTPNVNLAPQRPARLPSVNSESQQFLPPLHTTAFLVPDSLVAARLLAPPHQLDEMALYQLVSQSADQGTSHRIETHTIEPPFGHPGDQHNQAASVKLNHHKYPTEFKFAKDGAGTPIVFATRSVGTQLKANGRPADRDGTHHVTFTFEHHLAPPGETRWSANLADLQADHPSVVTQPLFHVLELTGTLALRPGESRLGGATLVPGWLNSKNPGNAQRLLIFLTLDKPSIQ